MGKLYDMYNEIQAPELEKEAEEVEVNEDLEVLAKFASVADELLSDEFGEDYEAADVEKLAGLLIGQAQEEAEMLEKVAEIDDFAQIVAEKVAAMFIEDDEE